ncbi:MAG: hypothetical protein K8F91_03320 [Candidatus Obscuribacterales bacterium]|nr:hypothetical protein [Candidatus Obscuribacterales bacterium]
MERHIKIPVHHKELLESLNQAGNLDRAFRCLEQADFCLAQMDVLAQDEFSHDVIVPVPDSVLYLVLAVT